jgi:hypothetical protein
VEVTVINTLAYYGAMLIATIKVLSERPKNIRALEHSKLTDLWLHLLFKEKIYFTPFIYSLLFRK